MKIGNFDTDERVLVVAEIGNNHEGNLAVAKKMVEAAADCGVGAVKFQTFRTEYFVSRADQQRFARLESFELEEKEFGQLANLAHRLDLLFISTPFDLASAAVLGRMVDAYKIASGDNNFYPLIGWVAQTGKPVIISTGASDAGQVRRTVDFVQRGWDRGKGGKRQLAILHCVSSYPVEAAQANLRSIPYLINNFPGVTIGYSDHTVGLTAPLAAVALGAKIVEKHFTLDKNYSDFRDHKLSADPPEMKELVQRISEEEKMMGSYGKEVQEAEREMFGAIRRSIAAGRDLKAGHVIEADDLIWLRPAGGLPPGEENRLVGRRLKRDVVFGQRLLASDVSGAVRSKAAAGGKRKLDV